MKKGFTVIELLILIAMIIFLIGMILLALPRKAHACTWGIFGNDCPQPSQGSYKTESNQLESVQEKLIRNVPIPQLSTSQERLNIKHRAELFNSEDKISYIYLVNYGKVMAFYTVKGKVSSLRSYMVPQEKLVDYKGRPCGEWYATSDCFTVAAPDIDGSYGENADGIFFFTTEGAYVEWLGDYMMSDQPLKLTTQPELVREIK